MEKPVSAGDSPQVRAPHNPGSTAPWIMLGIVALIVIAGFVILFPNKSPSVIWEGITGGSSGAPSQNGTPSPDSFSPAGGARVLEDGKYVTYVYFTGHAFVPDSVIVSSGEKVRFVDASNLTMRVGSRPESLSSVPYSAIVEAYGAAQGSTFDYVLSEPGIWSYENLASTDPRIFGVVYVR